MQKILASSILVPIPEGKTAAACAGRHKRRALPGRRAVRLFTVLAGEHHNMPASPAPPPPLRDRAVAAATSTCGSVQAGIIAAVPLRRSSWPTQFGPLATLFPGRIDLGLGWAPGTDMAPPPRCAAHGADDSFPAGRAGTDRLFSATCPDATPGATPFPARGTHVPSRILGSSLLLRAAGRVSRLALRLSAFAFSRRLCLDKALSIYRSTFQRRASGQAPCDEWRPASCAAPTMPSDGFADPSASCSPSARLRTGRPAAARPTHDVATAEVPAPVIGPGEQGAVVLRHRGSPRQVRDGFAHSSTPFEPERMMWTGIDPTTTRARPLVSRSRHEVLSTCPTTAVAA